MAMVLGLRPADLPATCRSQHPRTLPACVPVSPCLLLAQTTHSSAAHTAADSPWPLAPPPWSQAKEKATVWVSNQNALMLTCDTTEDADKPLDDVLVRSAKQGVTTDVGTCPKWEENKEGDFDNSGDAGGGQGAAVCCM
jgi:hypothetical protein